MTAGSIRPDYKARLAYGLACRCSRRPTLDKCDPGSSGARPVFSMHLPHVMPRRQLGLGGALRKDPPRGRHQPIPSSLASRHFACLYAVRSGIFLLSRLAHSSRSNAWRRGWARYSFGPAGARHLCLCIRIANSFRLWLQFSASWRPYSSLEMWHSLSIFLLHQPAYYF